MVYELVGREEGGEALLVVPLGGAVQRRRSLQYSAVHYSYRLHSPGQSLLCRSACALSYHT